MIDNITILNTLECIISNITNSISNQDYAPSLSYSQLKLALKDAVFLKEELPKDFHANDVLENCNEYF